jgi:hypothetical protein
MSDPGTRQGVASPGSASARPHGPQVQQAREGRGRPAASSQISGVTASGLPSACRLWTLCPASSDFCHNCSPSARPRRDVGGVEESRSVKFHAALGGQRGSRIGSGIVLQASRKPQRAKRATWRTWRMWPAPHTQSLLTSAAWRREREWVHRQTLAVAEGYLRALRCFDPAPPDPWPQEVEVLVTRKQRSLAHDREPHRTG